MIYQGDSRLAAAHGLGTIRSTVTVPKPSKIPDVGVTGQFLVSLVFAGLAWAVLFYAAFAPLFMEAQ